MPRGPRSLGESGFYHVVVKGDGGQILFEGDRDRLRYLSMLAEAQDDYRIAIHAYCLMSNHVHLLVQDKSGKNKLSAFMKQLNERYAMYYCYCTHRVGHVFQTPFWSEPIEDDRYFLSALRYIHANPEVAGMCEVGEYEWSSYWDYSNRRRSSFVETEFALSIIGEGMSFKEFSECGKTRANPHSGSTLHGHLRTDELMRIALELLGRDTLVILKSMKPCQRAPHLSALLEAGFSVAEIVRVTGLGRKAVIRAVS